LLLLLLLFLFLKILKPWQKQKPVGVMVRFTLVVTLDGTDKVPTASVLAVDSDFNECSVLEIYFT
jgi:hypothetical protein